MKPQHAILALVVVPLSASAAVPLTHDDAFELEARGVFQVTATGQQVDDPAADDTRAYLFLNMARLGLHGALGRSSADIEVAFGGEDLVVAPYPGVGLGLLDLWFMTPIGRGSTTQVKVGQFKVPFGREELANDGALPFAGRSIDHLGFVVGRDVGCVVMSRPGPLTLIGGVFTGGGRDVPAAHELPEDLGVPLLVARIGVGDVDENPFALDPRGRDGDGTRGAFFVSGLYTKDSIVAHSTVLNVKLIDKSLVLDSNWNPYIGAVDDPGVWMQGGADAAFQTPVGRTMLTSEIEGTYASYKNTGGELGLAGGRIQGGARHQSVEVAARYAVLFPDEAFPTAGTDPIQEITPAVSWNDPHQHLRLVLDVPVVLGAPVYVEDGVGAYVGTDMPEQAALVAEKGGGSVNRQTVLKARLMVQGEF